MSRANNRFAKGSGVYKCRCCGLMTRETGEGESSLELCALDYEAAGLENEISDYGDEDGKKEARLAELRKILTIKGGKITF